MRRRFLFLLKKDFKLMLSSKFLLLILGSLILYSCYINFFYANVDQNIYPVYLYDPVGAQSEVSSRLIQTDSLVELQKIIEDGYSIGIDVSNGEPEILMTSSGVGSTDRYRGDYALSLLSTDEGKTTEIVGENNREMKNRKEITSEFLFFELSAVGFLGLASMLFKEKQMGVIRVHGIMPVSKVAFILSKLTLFLVADLLFAFLITLINLGLSEGIKVLPDILPQAGILSLIMALVGFFCAVRLPDFRQFSLLYLVLAIFITTPVFIAGQTGIDWVWINYHPMYHLFMGIKNAYFATPSAGINYYITCLTAIILLFLIVYRALTNEMAKEG